MDAHLEPVADGRAFPELDEAERPDWVHRTRPLPEVLEPVGADADADSVEPLAPGLPTWHPDGKGDHQA